LAVWLDHLWQPAPNRILFLHMVCIGCFFAVIAHKTSNATSRDSRRRLFLLYAGAMVSLSPTLIVIIANLFRGVPAFTPSTPFVLSFLLMIVLFPLTIAYVIVVERAMDVRVAIRQGLQYLLASKGLTIIRLVLSAVVIVAVVVSFRDQRVSDAR